MSDRALRARVAELETALDKAIAALKELKPEYDRLCAEGEKLRKQGERLKATVRNEALEEAANVCGLEALAHERGSQRAMCLGLVAEIRSLQRRKAEEENR